MKEKHLNVADALVRLDGDRELLEEIWDAYLEDTPKQMEILRHALDDGDMKLAERQAHSIKSASGSIGANNLREIASRAEQAGKAGDIALATSHYGTMKTEFDAVIAEISELLG